MKVCRFAVLSALAVGALTLAGCACDGGSKSDSNTSAGMVGGKKDCCKEGAKGECTQDGAKASMGAVSEKKAGCCSGEKSKNECPAPATTNN